MSAVMRKSIFHVIGWAVAALFLTGCFHDVHEFRPSEFGDVPVGYVTASLNMDQVDKSTPISDLTIVAIGSGTTITEYIASIEDMSDELMQLPKGEYDILSTFNMTQANGYILSGLPKTKAGAANDVTVSLVDPASSPVQAWYGCMHTDIKEQDITSVDLELQPLLATLTVNISNLPDGTVMTLSISDVAAQVILNAKDGSGRYGVPGTQASADITTQSASLRLMPTVSGQERFLLTIELVSAQGTTFITQCDAPRLDVGKSYTLDLDYNTLRPYMYIASTSINPWTDGWTVQGEIFNPQK